MLVRILAAGAAQPLRSKVAESELFRLQTGVLASQEKSRRQSSGCERVRDGCQLDRFRPGPDDQPNIRETQSSPYLGGGNVPSVESAGKWHEPAAA